MCRNVLSKTLRPLIFPFCMINKNAISNTSINKYAEIGSPCLVPLSSLKQFVAVPSIITQDP